MTDILKVNVSRSYLKGPTGADRKENVVFGDILECRGPLDTTALDGYRRIDAVNWSATDARVGLFVKDDDLIPYDETPTEPPPAGQTLTIPPGEMQLIIVINGETKKFQNTETAILVESNG